MLVESNEVTVAMSGGGGGGSGEYPFLSATQTGANQVTLSWTYGGAEESWAVDRKVNGGAYQQITMPGQLASNARGFVDNGSMAEGIAAPQAGQTLTYRVKVSYT
jgi:hypothetical protein